WSGKSRSKTKRGFATKKEAQNWENQFKLRESHELDMRFDEFYKLYLEYCQKRFKLNTVKTKDQIFTFHILPFFEEKRMNEITPAMVTAWQNILLDERDDENRSYSMTYLKTIHNQLSAIFNHACRFYNLPKNPARTVGNMGKEESDEVEFWTAEEFNKFILAVEDKPHSSCAFRILFWGGLRLGELLALTVRDLDFKENTININKSYQRIDREDIITNPKTPKAVRVVSMPKYVMEEIQNLIAWTYGIGKDDRIFTFSKSFLHHEMIRGCKATGVKKIKVHALRHSHISLLIEKGFSVVDIGNRVGHESSEITFRYAHMFPNKQEEMREMLEEVIENV
ncbi:TPA: site-specific integrase, partial [Streptococcus equi subsp. zooepidemicus]|nr:site-specific integrase [Streptococcus equi subsp. zooepidemicus]